MQITKTHIAWIFVSLGLLAMLLGAALFIYTFFDIESPIDSNLFDHYGSFAGGIGGALFSIAAFIMVVETFNDQKKAQIETRFFTLLTNQRQIIEGFEYGDKKGYAVFEKMLSDFGKCLEDMKNLFSNYYSGASEIPEDKLVDTTYTVFFFGSFGDDVIPILKQNLPRVCGSQDLADQIINHYFVTVLNESTQGSTESFIPNGVNHLLGHYFRHLIHIVRYINQRKNLTYLEKYDFIKTLRAQMPDEEQILLFFNTLSFLGLPWEKGAVEKNKQLITKYNLIKNIPLGKTFGVIPKKYFPNLTFQGEEDSQQKQHDIKYCYR